MQFTSIGHDKAPLLNRYATPLLSSSFVVLVVLVSCSVQCHVWFYCCVVKRICLVVRCSYSLHEGIFCCSPWSAEFMVDSCAVLFLVSWSVKPFFFYMILLSAVYLISFQKAKLYPHWTAVVCLHGIRRSNVGVNHKSRHENYPLSSVHEMILTCFLYENRCGSIWRATEGIEDGNDIRKGRKLRKVNDEHSFCWQRWTMIMM